MQLDDLFIKLLSLKLFNADFTLPYVLYSYIYTSVLGR